MKTITIERRPDTFLLPADDLRAAYACASTEQTRYYLCGVCLEHDHLIALDGHVMIVIDHQDGVHIGADCAQAIIKCDVTDKAFKSKVSGGDLWVYGDLATGLLQFIPGCPDGRSPRYGVCEFEVVDGTFPDWRRVAAKPGQDGGCARFDPALLNKLVKAADIIHKGKGVALWPGTDNMAVEFEASKRLHGTLMKLREW